MDKSQKSFADPEARMMKTGDGSLQYAYNVQMAASEDGILVANGVTQQVRDTGQLLPMIEAVKRTTGRRPGWVLTLWETQDAGRAALRGDQGRDGIPSLRSARSLEGVRRMGSGVCGLQPEATERPAEAHPMSEPLLRPERTRFKSSSRGKPQARPATGTPARANLGSGS
jgi:hypothetical protein